MKIEVMEWERNRNSKANEKKKRRKVK